MSPTDFLNGRPGSGISRRRFLQLLMTASAAAGLPSFEALAAEVKNKKDLPVVVIGAGLGGLISAAYLAENGFPVTLLEKHYQPGGYATSFQRGGGKFDFEVSLHATVAQNAYPQQILSELGVWDKLHLVDVPELHRLVFPDMDLTLPNRDPEALIKVLIEKFPDQAKGIRGFVGDMVEVHTEKLEGRMRADSTMARLDKLTLAQWLDSRVTDQTLKKVLSCFWGYYGHTPSEISAVYYAVATGEYIVDGGQYYKARSQDLSDTLVKAITEAGGQVLLDNGAESIELKNGAVAAVVDAEGKKHPARAVVANAGPPVVFGRLISKESVPPDYLKKLGQKTPSLSSFIVWLGLKEELRGRVQGYEISLSPGNSPEESLQAIKSGNMDKVNLAVTVYDNLYPGYSKPGTTTMSIMSLAGYEPWKKFEADYFADNKEAYNQEKGRIADLYIKRVEDSLIPGLSSMIETREAATPLTNVRFTGNPGGAIYGYEFSGPKLDVRTPIPGLYLAGAWAMSGGYTPAMITGRAASVALLRDWKKLV